MSNSPTISSRLWLKLEALSIWRLTLVSLVGLGVSKLFKLDIITALAMTGLGIAFVAASWGFLSQNKRGFTTSDHIMSGIAGGGCALIGITILIRAWL